MKLKFLLFLGACGLMNAQTPELLYYNFNGSGTSVPNLASSPPAGTATGTVYGNQTLGPNPNICLGNGLVGGGGSNTDNYFSTNWNLNLTGSWTIHFKVSNYLTDTTITYFMGDHGSGKSFRLFCNGTAGSNNFLLRATGMTDLYINNALPITGTADFIITYDSVTGAMVAYKDGVSVSTVTQPVNMSLTSSYPLKVGGYGVGNNSLKAGTVIDEFGLFNRVITAAEIATLSSACLLSVDDVNKPINRTNKLYVKDGQLFNHDVNFGEYSIYDMSGKLMLKGVANSKAISISTLQKGLYIINYKDVSQKFVY